ncbi:peptidoglycan-binding protein [Amycolatopsis carbonis]|uniref:Peptidoglycan-binding protein n=1 Tax=Amycolatopsis carbonis TaxID=715471 RepID=A0A9Y2I900_9PSEU|nr:peptidoglycan-binding protein [Amycolatopsis sp. 2-15]WIX76025.1 peptidoglycan-binding protein [Amycolatopsis sp. 2-15]
MATSQNGWPATEDRGEIGICALSVNNAQFPGGVKDGDVRTVLEYVANQFHARVEPLDADACWGYYYRPIRGSQTVSNHASGTALDFNAPHHPQGKQGTFTPAQVAEIRKILDEVGGVVTWGGEWDLPTTDEMHFEISGDDKAVAEAAARLKSGGSESRPTVQNGDKGDQVKAVQRAVGVTEDGVFGGETLAAVKKFQQRHGLAADGVVGPATWAALDGAGGPAGVARATLDAGSSGADVTYLQNLLNKLYPAYSKLAVDGQYGPATAAVVREFQKRAGLAVDGVVGPQTWAKLAGG